MGKLIPWSFEKIRSGEQIQPPTFTNVAAAVAAGVTAAKFPRRIIYLSAGGTGSVPCLAISDGTNWKQIAIGVNAILPMNGLLPIIRRVRRPLLPPEAATDAKPAAQKTKPAEQTTGAEKVQPKADHGKAAARESNK